jgi:hypothetical protein
MLGEVDDNRDGFLTQAQWSKVELWFQYKALHPGAEDDLEAPNAIVSKQQEQQQRQAYDRAGALKTILWEMFSGPLPPPPGSSSDQQQWEVDTAPQIDFKAVLLYLCPDRDMFTGIKKAFSVATSSVASNARAVAGQVHAVAYPMHCAAATQELAAQLGRAPFDVESIKAVVETIFEGRKLKLAAQAPAAASAKGGKSAAPGPPAAEPDVTTSEAAAEPSVSAEQLMYSAGGERLVAQLLHRYQWKDIYVLSKML